MLKDTTQSADITVASEDSAKEAGLSFVSDDTPGIARQRSGRMFSYVLPSGADVRDERTLNRIRALAIPPAWRDVWICPRADGHIQATGRDARGRKTGKEWNLKLNDRRVARIVRSCQELPGQHLFQYADDRGAIRQITSTDVNEYIRSIAGPNVSAKDFRTWSGTVLAAMALQACEPVATQSAAKRSIRRAITCVAARLGNTPAICRKCYVHPEVLEAYLDGALDQLLDRSPNKRFQRVFAALPREEAATFLLLQLRSARRRSD